MVTFDFRGCEINLKIVNGIAAYRLFDVCDVIVDGGADDTNPKTASRLRKKCIKAAQQLAGEEVFDDERRPNGEASDTKTFLTASGVAMLFSGNKEWSKIAPFFVSAATANHGVAGGAAGGGGAGAANVTVKGLVQRARTTGDLDGLCQEFTAEVMKDNIGQAALPTYVSEHTPSRKVAARHLDRRKDGRISDGALDRAQETWNAVRQTFGCDKRYNSASGRTNQRKFRTEGTAVAAKLDEALAKKACHDMDIDLSDIDADDHDDDTPLEKKDVYAGVKAMCDHKVKSLVHGGMADEDAVKGFALMFRGSGGVNRFQYLVLIVQHLCDDSYMTDWRDRVALPLFRTLSELLETDKLCAEASLRMKGIMGTKTRPWNEGRRPWREFEDIVGHHVFLDAYTCNEPERSFCDSLDVNKTTASDGSVGVWVDPEEQMLSMIEEGLSLKPTQKVPIPYVKEWPVGSEKAGQPVPHVMLYGVDGRVAVKRKPENLMMVHNLNVSHLQKRPENGRTVLLHGGGDGLAIFKEHGREVLSRLHALEGQPLGSTEQRVELLPSLDGKAWREYHNSPSASSEKNPSPLNLSTRDELCDVCKHCPITIDLHKGSIINKKMCDSPGCIFHRRLRPACTLVGLTGFTMYQRGKLNEWQQHLAHCCGINVTVTFLDTGGRQRPVCTLVGRDLRKLEGLGPCIVMCLGEHKHVLGACWPGNTKPEPAAGCEWMDVDWCCILDSLSEVWEQVGRAHVHLKIKDRDRWEEIVGSKEEVVAMEFQVLKRFVNNTWGRRAITPTIAENATVLPVAARKLRRLAPQLTLAHAGLDTVEMTHRTQYKNGHSSRRGLVGQHGLTGADADAEARKNLIGIEQFRHKQNEQSSNLSSQAAQQRMQKQRDQYERSGQQMCEAVANRCGIPRERLCPGFPLRRKDSILPTSLDVNLFQQSTGLGRASSAGGGGGVDTGGGGSRKRARDSKGKQPASGAAGAGGVGGGGDDPDSDPESDPESSGDEGDVEDVDSDGEEQIEPGNGALNEDGIAAVSDMLGLDEQAVATLRLPSVEFTPLEIWIGTWHWKRGDAKDNVTIVSATNQKKFTINIAPKAGCNSSITAVGEPRSRYSIIVPYISLSAMSLLRDNNGEFDGNVLMDLLVPPIVKVAQQKAGPGDKWDKLVLCKQKQLTQAFHASYTNARGARHRWLLRQVEVSARNTEWEGGSNVLRELLALNTVCQSGEIGFDQGTYDEIMQDARKSLHPITDKPVLTWKLNRVLKQQRSNNYDFPTNCPCCDAQVTIFDVSSHHETGCIDKRDPNKEGVMHTLVKQADGTILAVPEARKAEVGEGRTRGLLAGWREPRLELAPRRRTKLKSDENTTRTFGKSDDGGTIVSVTLQNVIDAVERRGGVQAVQVGPEGRGGWAVICADIGIDNKRHTKASTTIREMYHKKFQNAPSKVTSKRKASDPGTMKCSKCKQQRYVRDKGQFEGETEFECSVVSMFTCKTPQDDWDAETKPKNRIDSMDTDSAGGAGGGVGGAGAGAGAGASASSAKRARTSRK